MKPITIKAIYWTTTVIIFIFDGVLPAFTFNSQAAVEGIRHLGFPDYFRIELTFFKVLGALVLILPMIPGRYKEWAYVGFGIYFLSAAVGLFVVDGPGFMAVFPLIIFAILAVSYIFYHKMQHLPQQPGSVVIN